MKGVILSLPVKGKAQKPKRDFSLLDFVRRNLSTLVFTLFFAMGIVLGALRAMKSSPDFLLDMDFLFTTNLESRLSQSIFNCFAAHFASNFIFFAVTALCGLAPWGVGVLPFVVGFKGFGTGLSAAYLMSSFGLKGLGFYLLVVLPGTFVFSLSLLFMCSESSKVSLRLASFVFGKTENPLPPKLCIKNYLFRCAYFLLLSAVGAVCDMLFWSFASKLFF